MALKNYKLESEDGSVVYRQFEEDDEGLAELRKAAKDKDHPLKSVTQGDPTPIKVVVDK